jgi:hypothetical protein
MSKTKRTKFSQKQGTWRDDNDAAAADDDDKDKTELITC